MSEMAEYLAKIEKIAGEFGDYKTEAYNFVLAGLSHTVSKLGKPRHVTGQELSVGIGKYAVEQFGPLAKTVMDYWGLAETYDLGKIVYRLIDAKLMSKTEEDSLEDFRNVYSFDRFFDENFHFIEEHDESE